MYQNALDIRNSSLTDFLCSIIGVKKAGHTLKTNMFFDTIKFTPRNGQNEIIHRANKHKINLRYYLDGSVRNLSPFRLHVSCTCMYLQFLCANNLSPLRLNAICIFYVYVPANSYDFCLGRLEFLWMKQLKEKT